MQPIFHQRFDLLLALVGKLLAVRAEQLDAVVLKRIVRGGDHHAEIGAQRPRQHGDGRRRQRTEQKHVHADGSEAGHQRRFDHVAGEAGIFSDHHTMPVLATGEGTPGRHTGLQGDFRSHRKTIRKPPDSVGAKQFACHENILAPVRRRFPAIISKSSPSRPTPH